MRTSCAASIAAVALLAACVSASVERDVARVRELSRAEALPALSEGEVEPGLTREAQELLAAPLDEERAVRVALLNNRELRAKLRELGVSRGRLIAASAVANPVVGAELPAEHEADLELHVEYAISSLLLASVRDDEADAELERAQLDAAEATVALAFRTRAAFLALQGATLRLSLAQRALDAQAASRDAAVALREAGNLRALDSAIQVAAYERSRVVVAEHELAVARAREALVRLLSLHGSAADLRVEGELGAIEAALPDLSKLETRAVEASLELGAARKRLEALAHRSGALRAEGLVPDVTLSATARHADEDEAPLPAGEDPWSFGAGVELELPLFDRGRGPLRASEGEFDAQLERYHAIAVEVRSAARELSAELQSAHARARHYASVILPAQARVLEEALLQYNAMQIGVQELLRARREQLEQELAHVEALRQYWTAHAAFDALLRGHRMRATGPAPASSAAFALDQAPAAGGH